jgi:signal transduction histidine kinase
LRAAQDRLIQSEKLASLGQLTAGIAHEIKNPLNFVTNFAELSVELAEEARELVDTRADGMPAEARASLREIVDLIADNAARIDEHGKRADGIVNGMLLHSRGESGDRSPMDVNAILDECVNLAYHGLRGADAAFDIAIEKDCDPTIGEIVGFPQELSRVFLNLINNACYATQTKKRARGDAYTPRLVVRTRNAGDRVEVRVRDNGDGIPKGAEDDVFTPFFTTKPAGQGTGLGLSIAYEIVVTHHGGAIRFETEAGEYTEFIVTLPKHEGARERQP